MTLISFSFVVFLIFLISIYFLIPGKYQWMLLLTASFVFYLSNGIHGVLYILTTIVTQYFFAKQLDKKNQQFEQEVEEKQLKGKEKAKLKKVYASVKKKFLIPAIVINVGLLCFVKYTGVIFDGVHILVPLGISFYTFKSVGYVIDVYRGKEKAEGNIFKFALYTSFFPAIIQGPIDRYHDLAPQLYVSHNFDYTRVTFGLQRMLWGYIKKIVIADRIAVVVNEIFNNYDVNGYAGFVVFAGVFLYGVQLYADFSGGMDIVNGLSETLGIYLTENFERPYMARSVSEFWQRWHITLGAWFRNYLFYPISLSKPFNNFGKKCKKIFGDELGKVIPPSIASFIVFLIIGIWHGVGWKYVVYGLYQAYFVSTGTLFERGYGKLRAIFRIDAESGAWKLFQMFRTILAITIGRYISRAPDLTHVFGMMKATIEEFNPWVFFDGTFYNLGLDEKDFRFMLFSIGILFITDILKERNIRLRETIARQNIICRWAIYYTAIFSLIIFGMYGTGYDASAFIYQAF